MTISKLYHDNYIFMIYESQSILPTSFLAAISSNKELSCIHSGINFSILDIFLGFSLFCSNIAAVCMQIMMVINMKGSTNYTGCSSYSIVLSVKKSLHLIFRYSGIQFSGIALYNCTAFTIVVNFIQK